MFPSNNQWNNNNNPQPNNFGQQPTPTPSYSYGYAHHQQQAFTQPVVPVVTPEQQLAIQQNLVQWQQYQQQYQQWHAMYGEQYAREVQGKLLTPQPVQPPLPIALGHPAPPPPPGEPPSDPKPPEPPAEGNSSNVQTTAVTSEVGQQMNQGNRTAPGAGYGRDSSKKSNSSLDNDQNRFGNRFTDGGGDRRNSGNDQQGDAQSNRFGNRGRGGGGGNNNRGGNNNNNLPSLLDDGGQNNRGRGGSDRGGRGGRGNNNSNNSSIPSLFGDDEARGGNNTNQDEGNNRGNNRGNNNRGNNNRWNNREGNNRGNNRGNNNRNNGNPWQSGNDNGDEMDLSNSQDRWDQGRQGGGDQQQNRFGRGQQNNNNNFRNNNRRNDDYNDYNNSGYRDNDDDNARDFNRNQRDSGVGLFEGGGDTDYRTSGPRLLPDTKPVAEVVMPVAVNPDEKTPEELAFDLQFQKWETDFEDWKKANVNHPDRVAYREYEMKFEECRVKLLERREQMKRKKLEAAAKSMPATPPVSIGRPPSVVQEVTTPVPLVPAVAAAAAVAPVQIVDDNTDVEDENTEPPFEEATSTKKQFSFTNSFFNSAGSSGGGIPGLDMAESDVKDENPDVKKIVAKVADVPVIDLVDDEQTKKDDRSAAGGNMLPDMNEFSKNVNSLLGNQQLLSLLSSFNKPDAVQSVAAVAPLLNVLGQINSGDVQKLTLLQQQQLQQPPPVSLLQYQKPPPINPQHQQPPPSMQQPNLQQLPPSLIHMNTPRNFNPNMQELPPKNPGMGGNFSLNRSAFDFGGGNEPPPNMARGFGNNRMGGGGGNNNNNNQLDQRFGNQNNNNSQRNSDNFQDQDDRSDRFGGNDRMGRNPFDSRGGGNQFENMGRNQNFGRGGGGGRFDNFNRNDNNNRSFDEDGSRHSDQGFGGNRQQFNRMDNDRFGNQNFDDRSRNSGQGFDGTANDNNNDNFDDDEFDGSKYEEEPEQDTMGQNPQDFNSDFGRDRNMQNFGGNFGPNRQQGFNQGPNFGNNRNMPSNFDDRRNSEQGFGFKRNQDFPPPLLGGNMNEPPPTKAAPDAFRSDNVMEEFEYYRKQQELNKDSGDVVGNSDGFNRKRDYTGEPKPAAANDFFRPTTVIDYQNKSTNVPAKSTTFSDMLLPTKVVDYGHKKPATVAAAPPPAVVALDMNRKDDGSKYLAPMKTFDYGHTSKPTTVAPPIDQKNRSSKAALNRKKNMKKRLKRHERVPDHAVTESNPLYPGKWRWINDTRDLNVLPTKRGKRKRKGVPVKRKEVFPKVATAPDVAAPVVEEKEGVGKEVEEQEPIEDLGNAQQEWVVLDDISSGSDEDMDLETDDDDGRFYVKINDLLLLPSRTQRPKKIAVILRGPPGSGKSHLAKLIKEKEASLGGSSPRILCLDDYFMTEVDEIIKCPDTGRRITQKKTVYEYEKEMEKNYMQCLVKSFKKTVTDGLHNFIIVDCVNQTLDFYNEFYSFGSANGFKVYTCELPRDLTACLKRNTHKRAPEEIEQMIKNWPDTPDVNIQIDCRALFKGAKKTPSPKKEEVEETTKAAAGSDEVLNENNDEDDEASKSGFFSSKWDADTSEKSLARLDGISKPLRHATTLEDYLQIDGWEPSQKPSKPGQKRVRWADIEEKRQQDKMRAIGFVVGQTNWDRMMDTSDGSDALVKTKYIERVRKN